MIRILLSAFILVVLSCPHSANAANAGTIGHTNEWCTLGDFQYYIKGGVLNETLIDLGKGYYPTGIFITIPLQIRNIGREPRTIPDFRLVDENGAEYQKYEKSYLISSTIGGLTDLNPSMVKDGILVFDIPGRFRTYRLKVWSRLLLGDSGLISLDRVIEDENNEVSKRSPGKGESIISIPPLKEKIFLLKTFHGLESGVSTRKTVIQKYGEPFLQTWEELRYETGQHSDFKEYVRLKFMFDGSGLLKEIRATQEYE